MKVKVEFITARLSDKLLFVEAINDWFEVREMATIYKVQELILEINQDEIDEYLSYDKYYLYNCNAKLLLEEKCNLVVIEVIKTKFLEKDYISNANKYKIKYIKD